MSSHTEKVAAGLRAMRIEPDAFIYFYENEPLGQDVTYDEPEILKIPVYRAGGSCDYCGFTDYDVPFLPVWKEQTYDKNVAALARFRNAYQDT